MANTFTYQVLSDTNKRTVIKLTGEIDALGETSNTKIQGRLLRGALANDSNGMVTVAMGGVPRSNYRYSIDRIAYDINPNNYGGYLKIQWDGTTPATIVNINGSMDLNVQDNLGSMTNNAVNPNGNVTFTTVNFGANGSYTVLLEILKATQDYDQGQIARPQDFNIPGVTPPAQNRVY